MMAQIDCGEVHLWFAYPGEITDPYLLAEYRSLLTEDELRQLACFRFERDQHRYLVTRAMVRTVLSKYADVPPREWLFAVNAYGRPSVAPQHADAGRIQFNVSHTDGLIVMGITRERAVGVDVENVHARQVDIKVADRHFTAVEIAALRGLPRDRQHVRFFEYWTLKESYLKARGMGLSIPLDHFAFHLEEPAGIRLTVDPRLHDHSERWAFWQLRFCSVHVGAVCTERVGAEQPHLVPARRWR